MRKPKPRVIKLKGSSKFRRLLGKEAGGINLSSGFVNIRPGKCVGVHSTGHKKEILIILQGKARIYYGERKSFKVAKGTFVYIPTDTCHNVENIGRDLLKYVYITAAAGTPL